MAISIIQNNHSIGTSNKDSPAIDGVIAPYLAFSQISKSFGSKMVLNRVSFAVKRGETVSIMGRSGVEKSVCLQLLMGFLKPDAGRVVVIGEDITDYSEEQLESIHKKMTMVFQNGALFDSFTVRENVAYVMRARGVLNEDEISQRVNSLLDMVGIVDERDRYPAEISIGIKRAVAIARAISESPEVVLYDEPTTMVDPIMVRRLGDLIRRLKVQLKLTSVVVTHDTRLAKQLSDHVMFLDKGKVLFFGSVSEMKRTTEPLIQEFLKDDQLDVPGTTSA
jgi:phospholipid/cholesterol/gamma-HCH transport system ATP-binding protein